TSSAVTALAAVWKRANESVIAFFGTMRVAPRPTLRNGAYFCLRWNTTVLGSGASTEATLSEIEEHASGLPRQFFERWRSYVNFTSAEVISVPSWNRTPVLSLIV